MSEHLALVLQVALLILGAGVSWGVAQSRVKEARALASAAARDARDAKAMLTRHVEEATAPLTARLAEHARQIAVLERDVQHGSERVTEVSARVADALGRIEGQVAAVHRRLDALMERLAQGGGSA